MFIKNLVDLAYKKPGGNSDSLKSEDLDPRLVFHYGVPSASILLAYDSIQQILAVATEDGRIKLYGKDSTQAILESTETKASKFLKFAENQGILINLNVNNHIEVWDVDRKVLSHVHISREDITSVTILQHSPYMYIGDSGGNVSILRLDSTVKMKYTIPFSAAHGTTAEAAGNASVVHIIPQPTAESTRVLIVYRDGVITLWSIPESKRVFTTGGTVFQAVSQETKKATSACWVCPSGRKVAIGYSNGEIFIWSISTEISSKSEQNSAQFAPISKLNLGYKLDKVGIQSLKWDYADGEASRLYVMGAADVAAPNLLQVVLLNEQADTPRTIKLGLHLPEPCADMAIISSSTESRKNKQDALLVLGKSGHVYLYDDSAIEKYLLQSQSKSSPSLPKEIMVQIPYIDSSITIAKYITDNSHSLDEDNVALEKIISPLFPFGNRSKDSTDSPRFSNSQKSKNLCVTGHSNGAINFWHGLYPLMLPLLSITQQSEDDHTLSGIAVTALHFDSDSGVFISGDQSGMVRIINLKPDALNVGSSKKGSKHAIQSLKLVRVNGAVLSIGLHRSLKHLAIGTDQGYVCLIEMEKHDILYQKHVASELCKGIISLQFETCSIQGFNKNILVIATKDSSVLALEADTGNSIGSDLVHPKKPSRAFFMQILDGQDESGNSNGSTQKQLSVLLCSEKAAYVYSLAHVLQGIKKVLYKKKFHTSPCSYASTFSTPNGSGLILLFDNGKSEIRSLPELSNLKEAYFRGFTLSNAKQDKAPYTSVCSSGNGEVIVVSGDQEMFVFSVLHQNKLYRNLEVVSQVYNKDLTLTLGVVSQPSMPKEKKKGLFSFVTKDTVASKGKHLPIEEAESARESLEELAIIFSVENFPSITEIPRNLDIDKDEDDLDIDDIDIEDPAQKPKTHPIIAAINKQKLTSKLNAFKGKLKDMTSKSEKAPVKEEPLDEKAGAVDEIKKKYGFASSGSGDTSYAKMAENKLRENLTKLQGISLKSTQMQDSAQSYSSLAKEVLRTAEHGKK